MTDNKILGFRVYGDLMGYDLNGFVIDEEQVDLLTDSIKASKLIKAAIGLARKHNDSVQISNYNFSVEVVTHDVHGPCFVLLQGRTGFNRFITSFNASEGDRIRYTSDGALSYNIIGFADSYSEAQCKLYGRTRPSFAVVEALREYDI